MYQYIERKQIEPSDRLSLAILEDNEGNRETVSHFLERDKDGFLIRFKGRSILVTLDWRNCVCVKGPYPNEVCLLPMVPAFCASMENCFHNHASDDFKQIVRQIFSADYEESS